MSCPEVHIAGYSRALMIGEEFDRLERLEMTANVATLGEAIDAYATRFGISITPCEPDEGNPEGKYWVIIDPQSDQSVLTDIRVQRGDELLRPDRDLAFPLQNGDGVYFVLFGC